MFIKKFAVKQRDITDCGAACLSSVAAYYKLQVPVSSVRQYAGTDKKGTNVLGLVEAAEVYGFQAKGVKGNLESLRKIPVPSIAHVIIDGRLAHYIVIFKVGRKLTIMDPADGRFRQMTFEEFGRIWTGVLVLMLPSDAFKTGNTKVSNAKRFWQLIRPNRSIMMQAVVGALLYSVLGLSTSVYVQKLIDFVLVEGNIRLLNLLSLIMIFLLIFQLILGTVKNFFVLNSGQQIDARLILGYYKHLLRLPQQFFDTMRVGEIISRVNDAVKIRVFINETALGILVNVFIIGFSFILMFLYYWKLAVIMICIIPLYGIIYYFSNKTNRIWQRGIMEKSADLESQLVESINAAGTIKRFGLEEYSNNKTESRFVKLLHSIYRSSVYNIYIGTGAEFITKLFTIILLWSGSYFVIQRQLSPGELLSFYALIGYFTAPAAALIGANKSMQDALIASDRLFEIIDLEIESGDGNKVEMSTELLGNIEFNDVTFRYGTRKTVFNKLSLTIKRGSRTAIVGESGSGKSTLLSLLQNLYTFKQGRITIGGFDIRNISNKSLRRCVGVVPQHIELFAGSIAENIAIGDSEPDLQKIIRLSVMLGIDDFIEKLPDTYNTLLNEQGVNLSGGQRQRIAIARALYHNPDILILDEATSNLDPSSEHKVQMALDDFNRQGKTLIIISHRLTAVKYCNRILVLLNGSLIEEGTHQELMTKDGCYANLWPS